MTTEPTAEPSPEDTDRAHFLDLLRQNHGEAAYEIAEKQGWVQVGYQNVMGSPIPWLNYRFIVLCSHCLKQWQGGGAVSQAAIDDLGTQIVDFKKNEVQGEVFGLAEAECPHVRADLQMVRDAAAVVTLGYPEGALEKIAVLLPKRRKGRTAA